MGIAFFFRPYYDHSEKVLVYLHFCHVECLINLIQSHPMLSRLAAAVAELQEQEQQEEKDSNDNPALRLEQLPEDVLLAICKFLPRY